MAPPASSTTQRVAREVEAGRGPVRAQVLEREVRVAEVGDVARQHHRQDGLGVVLAGRAHGVIAGERGVHRRDPTHTRAVPLGAAPFGPSRGAPQRLPGCGNCERISASHAASGRSARWAIMTLADGVTV